jgi:hypothetical protein
MRRKGLPGCLIARELHSIIRRRLSGALIGHRLFVPWALGMTAIAAIGAGLAGQSLDTPRRR